jgi:alkanesulfonate monooxygenase SsuD/methylene tetrahydromethanopterin reductase-like flavin-dependent oxidoreductase (luciferase family)
VALLEFAGGEVMKLGVSLTSARKVDDVRRGAAWMVERAAAARDAGLDSLFVGDHHGTPGIYYQNVPITARLLADWNDQPAGCLFLFPLWNPVLLAEHVGTLAAIAKGRFIVQCALGEDQTQFGAMGASLRTRPSAFEESLGIVKRLLAGETVSSNGRFTFENARVALRPPEPVEYWIAGSADPAIDRAARLGDGWLAAPGLTLERAKRQLDLYLARCQAHGRPPTSIAIRRDIYVGESPADVDAVAGPILRAGYRGFDPGALVTGTVDEVVKRFLELRALGYTDVIIRHITDDQPKVLGSYERLGRVRAAITDA